MKPHGEARGKQAESSKQQEAISKQQSAISKQQSGSSQKIKGNKKQLEKGVGLSLKDKAGRRAEERGVEKVRS